VSVESTDTDDGVDVRTPLARVSRRFFARLQLPARLTGLSPRARGLVAVLVIAVLVGGWAGWRAWSAYRAYHDALNDVRTLQTYRSRDLASFSTVDLTNVQATLRDLRSCLRTLDDATSAPLGEAWLGQLPWLGPRYSNGRELLKAGLLLSDAGVTGATVGRETLAAYDAGGVSSESPATSATWLDTLLSHNADIARAAAQVEQAKTIREGIDARMLPARARAKLPDLDRALNLADYQELASTQLPVLRAALGGDGSTRYLVLFQNPAELRPSGGFPGTMALVTLERGQLRDYQVFDAHTLSDAYIAKNLTAYPQPWPIQRYFPSPELVLHDATWWADFPRGAALLLDMYQQTGWPAIDGVIAVQPSVISDLLRVTGPVTINVDDEERLITPDNVYDEIERQRRLHREGIRPTEEHKEALALIGELIMDKLKVAPRGDLRTLGQALRDEANRRDVQFYAANSVLQNWLTARAWTGSLSPDPGQPTLDLVLANVNNNKASDRLNPYVNLRLGPAVDGRRTVTMQLYLQNTGTNEEDAFYAGYQRWWVEATLPTGAGVTVAQPAPAPDPEAPSGGSYYVPVYPQQVGYMSITFTMPDTPTLLLRRQPGVVPLRIHLMQPGCDARDFALTQDTLLQLAGCH
jgi:hypothetical protein